MVVLHREAAAGAREQQEEVFAEKLQPVHRAERAVEEPGVVLEDGLAAELQRAHRRQHAFLAHRAERPVHGVRQRAAGQPLGQETAIARQRR
jgi:hypothetical protein